MQATLTAKEEEFPIYYETWSNGEVTFKGKFEQPIHNWFRLTPAYSPILVQRLMKYLGCKPGKLILDPFAGSGTTLIEAKRANVASVGVEINPAFYHIIKTSIKWNLNITTLKKIIADYLKTVKHAIARYQNATLGEVVVKENLEIPTIFNIHRWWREDVLKDLLLAKKILQTSQVNDNYKALIRAGIMCILVEVANIARNHPTLSFTDRSSEKIDVYDNLQRKLTTILMDLETVQPHSKTPSEILLGDSTKIDEHLKYKVDFIITSPPYPNRISYVWETRPHLYFFDIFKKPVEAGDLDCITIGGTWGKATSGIAKGELVLDKITKESLDGIDEAIRKKSGLMANYVSKYFMMMNEHISKLHKVLNKGAKLAYVVGNSRIKDVEVPTDIILARIFEKQGFEMDRILRVRKRIGRRNIYEAIVMATKP